MALTKLMDFLNEKGVAYRLIRHSPAYTSQAIAEAAHVSGKRLAKVTMVKVDEHMAMAVLPATERVDTSLLARLAHAEEVQIASEREFSRLFPGCETGAMPPFGNLFGMPVFVSAGFGGIGHILFEAGTHRELLEMEYEDFIRLVEPRVGHFTHGDVAYP